MKDWEDIIKERQLSRKAELPESDWNDFLSRREAHERAAKRRHGILAAAISIPAAAAVLLLLFLIPFNTDVSENQVSQNEPSEQPVIADSVDVNTVDSVIVPAIPEPVKTVIIAPKPVKKIYAQDKQPEPQNHSVTGKIYDFDSAEPIYAAAVMIYQVNGADTIYKGGGTTDDNGEFIISDLEPGNYLANTKFLGFDDTYRNFSISPVDSTTDLGKIAMRGDQGRMLSEIAISAVVAKVQMLNDTAMFNSAAYKLPEGTSVEDLIRKLPGVQIDSIGNITVNGKAVSRILVNGKEFFNDDNSKSLTQLTAEMIEKVKAYEKNSDLSRQTGIDDGREELVLDFRKPIIVLDGQIIDVDEAKMAAFNFNKTVRKLKLARLLGIPANKIESFIQYDAASAMKIWGEQGEHGAISVVTKR